jgi:hypothetical protein
MNNQRVTRLARMQSALRGGFEVPPIFAARSERNFKSKKPHYIQTVASDPFDSEVRKKASRKLLRTSESGHSLLVCFAFSEDVTNVKRAAAFIDARARSMEAIGAYCVTPDLAGSRS